MLRPTTLALLVTLASLPVHAAGAKRGPTFPNKTWHTYPQPPKTKAANPLDPKRRMNLAYEVPEYPERWTFQTTKDVAGTKVTETGIHVFDFTDIGRPLRIGTLEVGRPFKVETVRRIGAYLYYGFWWDKSAKAPTEKGAPGAMLAYVNGNFIAPVSYNPPAN